MRSPTGVWYLVGDSGPGEKRGLGHEHELQLTGAAFWLCIKTPKVDTCLHYPTKKSLTVVQHHGWGSTMVMMRSHFFFSTEHLSHSIGESA